MAGGDAPWWGAGAVPWWITSLAMAVVAAICAVLGLTTYWTGRLLEWLWGRVSAWIG